MATVQSDSPKPNPANAQPTKPRRVPMSQAVRRLEIDPIDGWHLHWFKEGNVARAMDAGYQLVKPEEVRVNSRSFASDKSLGGNTDLGSCVSIVGNADTLAVERLVLMKLREEHWLEDKAALDAKNAQIIDGIFEGEAVGNSQTGGSTELPGHAYVGVAVLNRGARKVKQTRRAR